MTAPGRERAIPRPVRCAVDELLAQARVDLDRVAPGDLATAADIRYVVVCNEGYSSSLAAATLRRLGLGRATDLVGGFQAWSALSADRAPGHAASSRRAAYRAR